ncbi:RhoGAP domain containing protein [Acanthamoeba castellanii str. Neff]|uniref:RhoGAP domain containing protein n=1 Tax=Acanthamoeba castellanii (strain ATCC 30010 / Neff) TaxID=1257118 RepID=L8GE16_ACACF|nr:RhoGAP domain containing protein [Acanthamoeba castellanii str. Neff]ELR11340.1 RhoGAP domain containing protein [Acanthamoeba castellanii str. Neff]
MARLSQFQTMTETLKESLSRTLLSDVSAQLEVLVKSDLAESVSEKAKYDKYRRQYDAAMTRYRNAENKLKAGKSLAEEEKEVAEAKKELEKVTEEVTAVLEVINKKTEMFLFERFYFMFVAYEDFFTRGANLVRDLKPHMSRHQQCADQSKTEYEDLRARSRGFVPPSTPKAAIDPTKRLFGMPLADVMAREGGKLPRAVQSAIEFILRPEGKEVDYSKVSDPHVVAALLKMWLRSLPESIFPVAALARYLALNLETTPEDEQVRVLQAAVESLPEINKTALHAILYLCAEITKRQEENRMSASNLSTVLGPNLFFCETTDPQEMMKAMQPSSIALTLLIKQYPAFFHAPPSFLSSPPAAVVTAAASASTPAPATTASPSPSPAQTLASITQAETRPSAAIPRTPSDEGKASAPIRMGSRILTSSLSSSQTISSIIEATESLPTSSTTSSTTAAAPESEAAEPVAFCRSDEVLEAEREGPGAVTGPLVSSVTAFLNCIAPIVHADVATDDQVMALNRELKVVAAAIKEAFDQMPAHGTTYPGTKAPMAAAARHLRPAAKNLLTAAKSVNEAPGTSLPRSLALLNGDPSLTAHDRAARIGLLAATRELIGAAHSLTVAAAEVDTLACAPPTAETLLQQCAQHTGRLIHISTGTASDDVHATAFAALTAAEQLRYGTAAVAANLVNGPAAQQLLQSGEDVEKHLSQLSSLAVPLLGATNVADLRNDPALKDAARLVRLLRASHDQLAALETQLVAEAPSLSPEHAELLPHVRATLDHLAALEAATLAGSDDEWNGGAFAAAQRLAAEAALLVAGCSGGDGGTVHYLRQLVLLATAGAGARRLGDVVSTGAKAPVNSLPVPETLHPALAVAGLVAALSSFLRQLFFSSLVPST